MALDKYTQLWEDHLLHPVSQSVGQFCEVMIDSKIANASSTEQRFQTEVSSKASKEYLVLSSGQSSDQFSKWRSRTEWHRFQQRFWSHLDGLNISNSGWILLNLYQMVNKKIKVSPTLKHFPFSPKKVFLTDSSSYMFSRKIWILNNWQPNPNDCYLHRETV